MFCALGLVFGGTDGVGSLFLVLRSQTHFRRYRWCRVPFSRFARPDSFSAVKGASSPIFVFSAPGLIFGGSEGVGSCFHVLRARTRFRRYRGRRVPFSCYALAESYLAVPRESCPVFMCCAPRHVFGCAECVGSRFHVLRSRTRLRRYRWRRVPFSRFALLDLFSVVPSVSGPVFTFCVPGIVFGDIGGVRSGFLVLRARTRFRWYQGRPFSFSCFRR
jgi:hypothetical protein